MQLAVFALAASIAVLVMASSVLLHLLDEKNPDFVDLGNSAYFAMLSLTGQGTPSELQGLGMRLVGLSIILCGLALVGIITGTYSSIYIASALVLWWHKGQRPKIGAAQLAVQTAAPARS